MPRRVVKSAIPPPPPTPPRAAKATAYTETEARSEVVRVAREVAGFESCEHEGCDNCTLFSAVLADLDHAMWILNTYKGVK